MKNILTLALKDRSIKRGLAIQAVDLNTGDVVIFDESTPQERLATAVQASASIPGFFKPVEMDTYNFIDGGAFTNLDMSEAIVKCNEMGF